MALSKVHFPANLLAQCSMCVRDLTFVWIYQHDVGWRFTTVTAQEQGAESGGNDFCQKVGQEGHIYLCFRTCLPPPPPPLVSLFIRLPHRTPTPL